MRRRRIVITGVLILLCIVVLYWIHSSVAPVLRGAIQVAETVQRLKPEQAIAVMKVPRKTPEAELPADTPEFSRRCIDLWQDLSAFNMMGLVATMLEAKERGDDPLTVYNDFLRGIPDPGPCAGLPPAQAALLSEFKASCAPALSGRRIEEMTKAELKVLERCIVSATRLRAALSELATRGDPIEEIRDPDLLFERMLHAMNLFHMPGEGSGKLSDLTPERNAEIARLAERILEISGNENQRQFSVMLLVMTKINDLGLEGEDGPGFAGKLARMKAFAGMLREISEKYPDDSRGLDSGKMAEELDQMEDQLSAFPPTTSEWPAPRANPDRK